MSVTTTYTFTTTTTAQLEELWRRIRENHAAGEFRKGTEGVDHEMILHGSNVLPLLEKYGAAPRKPSLHFYTSLEAAFTTLDRENSATVDGVLPRDTKSITITVENPEQPEEVAGVDN